MAPTALKFFLDTTGQESAENETRFFRSLKVRNRNSKQTQLGRLDALNETAVELLTGPERRISAVLDVGISSGVTTVELFESLNCAGLTPAIVATDLSIYASIVHLSQNVRVLVDSAGDVLQYDIFGLAIRPWRRRLDSFTGMALVKSFIEHLYSERARKAAVEGGERRDRVALINPRLAANKSIEVCEDDLLLRNPAFAKRFDFIRAANVLNREYFDEATLARAIDTLKSYLSGPGAIILIVRTNDQTGHHGAFYELLSDNRLGVLHIVGDGSELASLIDAASL
ncbi:MAG: hypothetical protein U5J99_04950 [Parvularculaceae bacterium]|nr:hypothetical protein [Parvularculaceae bacterium]